MPEDIPPPGLTPTNYQRTTGGNLQWKPPTPEHLAAMLPQYEIEALIGHGGMGAVYKGRQKSLDRTVAIKILPPEAAGDEDAQFVERFKNEARTMAKMNHPAIVHVYDFGETAEGQLYIVMEFIDGTDVSKMIVSQGKLPPEHALAITAHVCDALHYAHKHNVIHRDIKPANIMINTEGAVKVADFGLAKANDPSQSGLTKTSMTMGTPDFVAPEALIAGTTVDGRADLYAMGVMLYQMLTGNIPRGMFVMPSVMVKTDPRFDGIISRAMQTDPQARYQTAKEMRRDLDVILTVPMAKEDVKNVSLTVQKQPAARHAGPEERGPQKIAADKSVRTTDPSASPAKSKTPLLIVSVIVIIGAGTFFFRGGSRETSDVQPQASATAATTDPTLTRPAASGTPIKAHENPITPKATPAAKPTKPESPAMSAPPTGLLTFAGHRYQLVMERLMWNVAKKKAEAMGGHLAVIDTQEKFDWVWDKFGSKLKKTPGDQASGRIFIGLQKPQGKDAWEWVTGSPLKAQTWMGQLPETKQDPAHVATIIDHSLDYVRPRGFPAAPFLVEWDDSLMVKAAGAESAKPATAALADKSPPAAPTLSLRSTNRRSADLIPLVDVQRDAVKDPMTGANVWKKENSSLTFADSEKAGRIAAPVSLAAARAFEIELLWKRLAKNIQGAKTGDSGSIALDVPMGAGRWVRVEVAKAGDKVIVGGKRIGNVGPATQNKDGLRIIVRSQEDQLSVIINGKDLGSITGLASHVEADLGAHAIFTSEPLPAVYCAPGNHEIVEWTVRALDGEVRLLWEPSLLQDQRIAQLESGYQARLESDALKPFSIALTTLNQSYITNGIIRARAAAQTKRSLAELTVLDAEKVAIEKGDAIPATDTADTPESLKTLRATYRAALAKITAEREAKAAPLYEIYVTALDAYIAELTKAGKIEEAKQVQTLRDAKAAMHPAPGAGRIKTR